MDSFESGTHSFIVKIWLEETRSDSGRPSWRGHITHVPSRHRQYVEDLNAVTDFISVYLQEMGVKVGDPGETYAGG